MSSIDHGDRSNLSGCSCAIAFEHPVSARAEDHPSLGARVVNLRVVGSSNTATIELWEEPARGGSPRQALTAIRDACQAWLDAHPETPAAPGES